MLKKQFSERLKQYPGDAAYFQTLAKELKLPAAEQYRLFSVMGAEELQKLLPSANYGHFLGDDQETSFKLNLHIHTSASDGILSPLQLLEQSLSYRRRCNLDFLVIAVTDHDSVASAPEILRLLIADPEKYAGLRVVLGCELSAAFKNDSLRLPVDFELLYYALNPFDPALQKLLSGLAESRQAALGPVIKDINRAFGLSLSVSALLASSSNLRKGLGCDFTYRLFQQAAASLENRNQEQVLKDSIFGLDTLTSNRLYKLHRTADEIATVVSASGFGFLSLAHPPRILLDNRLEQNFINRENAAERNPGFTFILQLMEYLRNCGLKALEYYYGNFTGDLKKSFLKITRNHGSGGNSEAWIRNIFDDGERHNLLKTGGYDTHSRIVFNNPFQKLLALWKESQSLIAEGYRALGKEMSMSLPGPCFPPLNTARDTGIGSPYGEGAARFWSFFSGTVDKILLGPAGKTTAASRHSPYVSEITLNPFLIPLEKLVEDGILKSETLEKIYKTPKTNGLIDFTQVETAYHLALREIAERYQGLLSEDEFYDYLVKYYIKQSDYSYIGDLQVQIPDSIYRAHPEAFLEGFSLGTPPDMFGKSRNWHFRLLNPAKMFNPDGSLGEAGQILYAIFRQAFELNPGGLRIDHYIGLVDPYAISELSEFPSGRLYSSPDHLLFGRYAKHSIKEFANITSDILLRAAREKNIKPDQIYLEDIGTRPDILDEVIDLCGLGRLLIAQFVDIDNDNHCFRLKNGRPQDVAALDTHDTASIHDFYRRMSETDRSRYAVKLAADLRFEYNPSLNELQQLIRMQWGALLASPCRRVQAFFTSFTGQNGRYNEPGNPEKWKLRCRTDFDRIYFSNLLNGTAYNPFDAIALAVYARGDDFFNNYRDLVDRLRRRESEILALAREL